MFDFDFLNPTSARKELKRLHQEAGTEQTFLKKEVPDLRKKCESDPFVFLETCFPHRFCQHGKSSWSPYHRQLWNVTYIQHQLQVICCFRGFGKSTLGNFGRTMYDICFNHTDFIVMGSLNERMVRKLIFPIQLELETNPRIIQLFGELRGDRSWSTQSLLTSNGVKIEGVGIGQSIRGALSPKGERPSILVLDDIVSQEAARSPQQKETLLQWIFSDILPALKPQGWSARLFATMISAESAIYDLFHHDDYKDKVGHFLLNIVDKKGRPTWPERFPAEIVAQLKASQTEYSWSGEYEMPPIQSGERMFRKEQIRYYRENDLKGKHLITLSFNDPASRTGSKNDFTAMPCVSLDKDSGNMYVRRGSVYDRITEEETVKATYTLDEMYPFLLNVFEGNGFQRLYEYIFRLMRQIKGYQPKIKTVTRTGDKTLRMMGLLPYLNSGAVFFLEDDPVQQYAIENDLLLVTYKQNHAIHDDWTDALIGAVEELQQMIRNVGMSATLEDRTPVRQYKTPEDILAHSQHEKSYLFQKTETETQVAQLLTHTGVEYRESPLERKIKQHLEKQKALSCMKKEYPVYRSFLWKWYTIYQQEGQEIKSCFAKQEIERLDQRFR